MIRHTVTSQQRKSKGKLSKTSKNAETLFLPAGRQSSMQLMSPSLSPMKPHFTVIGKITIINIKYRDQVASSRFQEKAGANIGIFWTLWHSEI